MIARLALFSVLLLAAMPFAWAENLVAAVGGKDLNQLEFIKKHGLNTGGWLATGGTLATDDPGRHNNSPITFNDRSSELQLNQLGVFLEKIVDTESSAWSFGGRADMLFGSDSRFTQARGLDNSWINQQDLGIYGFALPQAYLEVSAPADTGISAKIGHFYTIIGQEVVTAPNNFFYSHAYTMQYGEPFTHTGVLLNYSLNDNVSLNGGAVTGWDNFDQDMGNWNFLGGATWANDDASSAVSWSVISGDVASSSPANRTLSSLVFSHSFTDKLQYVFQHDFAFQEQAIGTGKTMYWYGVNQYLFYDISGTLSAGIRGEWFRDDSGLRLNTGSPGSYFAVTAGVNWKPLAWLTLRPELRYDWADTSSKPYANHTGNRQLELAVDAVFLF